MVHWGLQIKSNNFYFDDIALLGLNQTRLGRWVDGWEDGWVGGWMVGWLDKLGIKPTQTPSEAGSGAWG